MRILHVIPSIAPSHGGPSATIRTMTHALAARGHDVHVASTNAEGASTYEVPLDRAVVQDGVTFHYFKRTHRFYTYSRALSRWIAGNAKAFDVIHAHSLFSHTTYIASRHARQAGRPYIVRTLGSLAPQGFAYHPMLKRVSWTLREHDILRRAAVVHFTSIQEKEQADRLGGDWTSLVLPLGIDVRPSPQRDTWWIEATVPAFTGMFVIATLSRIHPVKRIDLAIRALAEAHDDTALVIAGAVEDHEYKAELQALASALHVSGRIHWAGHLAGKEKRGLLSGADMFMLLSDDESFGLAAVEALAAGLPTVLSSGVGIAQQARDAGAAVVVEQDPQHIAASIKQLHEDQQLRNRIGAAAATLAREQFSIDAMTDTLERVYREVTR